MRIGKIIALLLILAILAGGGYYILRAEKDDNDRMKNLYAEVEPLERERASLIEERDAIASEYALKFRDYATTEILFTTLDAQIVTDVYPIMRDHGVVGVLGFNYQEFPIYYNKMLPADCLRLIGDGWGTCVIFDQGWGDFTNWYNALVKSLASYNIPAPTTVYFPGQGYYSEEMSNELVNCGIRTVVLDATDGRTNTVTDVNGLIWYTGAMPWNYTGSATDTELLGRTDGANLCFTLKLNEAWSDKNSTERESFTAVLDSWKDMLYSENPLDELDSVGPTPSIYIDSNDKEQVHDTMQKLYLSSLTAEQQLLLPRFRSANFETALQYHQEAINNNSKMQTEIDARKASLDAQIAELDTRISDLYARWGDTQNSKLSGLTGLLGGKS